MLHFTVADRVCERGREIEGGRERECECPKRGPAQWVLNINSMLAKQLHAVCRSSPIPSPRAEISISSLLLGFPVSFSGEGLHGPFW